MTRKFCRGSPYLAVDSFKKSLGNPRLIIAQCDMAEAKRVEIKPAIRDKLIFENSRTGLGGRALMRGKRGKYPDGLTAVMIDKWRSGSIETAKPAHLEWVLKEYAAWSPPPPPEAPKKMSLTDEHRAFIQSEVERTGLGAVAILKHAPRPLPEGLNHQKVQRWISGQTKLVSIEHWNFVIRLYEAIKTEPQR